MTRVMVDARHFHSGIGRYVQNLAEGLADIDTSPAFEFTFLGDPEELVALPQRSGITVRGARRGVYSLQSQLEVSRHLRGVDLFHATMYPVPLAYRGPLIVNIQDLHHLVDVRSARERARWAYARCMLEIAVRRARIVITGSNASATQILARWPRLRSRLRVVRHALTPRFTRPVGAADLQACRDTLALPGRFVLCIGNLRPYKNVETVVRAFRDIADDTPAHLVLAGEGAHAGCAPVRLARRLGIEARVHALGRVPEALVPALMTLADVGAFASRMEGFGLPPLEMLACGTSVVVSDIPAHREVLGAAAVFVSPDDAHAWGRELLEMLEQSARRAALLAQAPARVQRFSLIKHTQAHMALYREALS